MYHGSCKSKCIPELEEGVKKKKNWNSRLILKTELTVQQKVLTAEIRVLLRNILETERTGKKCKSGKALKLYGLHCPRTTQAGS
jgi:hypothetical protein